MSIYFPFLNNFNPLFHTTIRLDPSGKFDTFIRTCVVSRCVNLSGTEILDELLLGLSEKLKKEEEVVAIWSLIDYVHVCIAVYLYIKGHAAVQVCLEEGIPSGVIRINVVRST